MLRVILEVNNMQIGEMRLVNVSQLAPVSDYRGTVLDAKGDDRDFVVPGHKRSDGAWELVRKALAAAKGESKNEQG